MREYDVDFNHLKRAYDTGGGVQGVRMSVEEARDVCDDLSDDGALLMAFDEAQGNVHSGACKTAYVVIRIGA
jgi:hypothetical protein